MKTLNLFQVFIMLSYAFYSGISNDISLISGYVLVVLLEIIEVFYNATKSSILSEIIDKDLMEKAVFLSVLLITILDCLVISSVMPLNIATQVFFQKNIKNKYRSRITSV